MCAMPNQEEHQHEWHLSTDFCIHCGISRLSFVQDPTVRCHRTSNVIAISHRISVKRIKELITNVLRTSHKSSDSNSK